MKHYSNLFLSDSQRQKVVSTTTNGNNIMTSSLNLDARENLKRLKKTSHEMQGEIKAMKRLVVANSQSARDILKDAFDRIKIILNTNVSVFYKLKLLPDGLAFNFLKV